MASDVEGYMLVGRVVGAHGIRGEVAVLPLTDDPDRFFDLERLFVQAKAAVAGAVDQKQIETVRLHKGCVLLKLAGVQTRNDAQSLIGLEVYIGSTDQLPLEEGRFFIDSLVGLIATDEGGTRVGTVVSVEDIPGNPLVCLAVDGGGDVLVPFSKNYVRSVDLGAARLVLKEEFRGLLNPVNA